MKELVAVPENPGSDMKATGENAPPKRASGAWWLVAPVVATLGALGGVEIGRRGREQAADRMRQERAHASVRELRAAHSAYHRQVAEREAMGLAPLEKLAYRQYLNRVRDIQRPRHSFSRCSKEI